jgi:ABC-type lipoprotein export system ATPase subunit
VVTQTGVTVVFASHDPNVQEVADRIYELQDGRLAAQINGHDLSSAELPISRK